MKVTININETVQVELTKDGAKAANQYAYDNNRKQEYYNGQIVETELWDLMMVLGGAICHGGPQLIVHNEITVL